MGIRFGFRRTAGGLVRLLLGCAIAGCFSTQLGDRESGGHAAYDRALCQRAEVVLTTDVEKYQDAVDQASRDYQIEQWKLETADRAGSSERLSALFANLQKISYDPKVLEAVLPVAHETAGAGLGACPPVRRMQRARELLETSILTDPKVIAKEKQNADLQETITKKSNAFRLQLPGQREPVSEAIFQKQMASLADRKKRESLYKMFNASRAIKWQEWGFKDLVLARNEEAKLAGYKNYYEYRFFRNQLDFANYRAMVDEIRAQFAPKVRKAFAALAAREGIADVEAWDFRYLRQKSSAGEINELLKDAGEEVPLNLAREFYAALGISVDDYHFTMDLFPRAGKNTHAFAMAVVFPHVGFNGELAKTPAADIRFLANLRRPVKWEDISTVIHEIGHAVHAAEVRQPYGIFRNFDSVPTESIAMTFERMASTPEFMSQIAFNPPPEKNRLRKILENHESSARLEQAITLLRQVFFSDFEYQMYLHPEADFADLWSRMYREYWGIEVQPFYADWDVDHFLTAPVYVENYAIGILMVEQLYASIRRDFRTAYRSKELGEKLRRTYFAPGVEFNYLDLAERFTGARLTAAAALGLLD